MVSYTYRVSPHLNNKSYLLALLPYLTSLHSAPLLDCTLLRYDITWTPSEGELAVGMI